MDKVVFAKSVEHTKDEPSACLLEPVRDFDYTQCVTYQCKSPDRCASCILSRLWSHLPSHLVSHQVTARLDRFPNASAEDLQRSDGVCIICREEMSATGANKRLFCGHVFHLQCLRCGNWLAQSAHPACLKSVCGSTMVCRAQATCTCCPDIVREWDTGGT